MSRTRIAVLDLSVVARGRTDDRQQCLSRFYFTSLRRSHFSRAQIAELYHLRWKAEELFKLGKSVYFDQRQFHAKSALGVRQEILAQAIYVVIARFLLAGLPGRATSDGLDDLVQRSRRPQPNTG